MSNYGGPAPPKGAHLHFSLSFASALMSRQAARSLPTMALISTFFLISLGDGRRRSSPFFGDTQSSPFRAEIFFEVTGASSRSRRGLEASRTARLPGKLTSEAPVPARERTGSLTDARISSHRSIFQKGGTALVGGEGAISEKRIR
ncbi:hypothetical protein CDAR_213731 [Caerostris darwini]|uniref:Uncharacterized protein n=1 Tax=Caerostris darwini TaxID=1538125 RepID=A0AAV4WZI6_9ARAC|nr:hypothetical protein CDAR_213731 [Caerostris darwini]